VPLTADEVTVFDNVVHVANLDEGNFKLPDGAAMTDSWWRAVASWPQDHRPEDLDHLRHKWSIDEIHGIVFDGSTDFAMAQTVPLFDMFEDGFAHVERQYLLKEKDSERVVFVGGADPVYHGADGAVREIERQITEMGARSMKFYNGHSRGRSWKCDDRQIAYPMYEKALELGVTLLQFHKGNALGLERIEDLAPHDLQQVALDFPEANIVIHHLAFPYQEFAIDFARRFPNIYLSMSAWVNQLLTAPVPTTATFGHILSACGAEKLLFGSELPLFPVARQLVDLVLAVQIPEELQDGYGYPEITDAMRRQFMGGNLMRLLGMDPENPKL
jgi:predicted TIM-barrel fold metal-dependent hydrolase